MEVYKSNTLTIEIDKDNSILFYQWNAQSEYLSQENFLIEAQRIHDEILENKVYNVLADDRNFFYTVVPEIQEFLAKHLLTSLNKHGLKKFAHVQSSEMIAQLSVEQVFEENTEAVYIDKYFDTIDNAKNWILSVP
jgi:hypothetical protein